MKPWKEFLETNSIKEEAPANAVAHGGVDMNPTGKKSKLIKKKKFYQSQISIKLFKIES